ncbi:serine-type endopeptidase [Curvularia clavata]|uniref:Serine-type endopeptidase n=1 Tax=Curvularia clavata TaxID=95742 RepID=A0A9Q8Z2S4_CURCL|nr:serine-type endopeptidase [Curvularia clavata]
MKYSLIAALPALAAASPTFSTETIHKEAAPVLSSTSAKEVPNSYMVVFKKHVKDASKHHDWVQSVHSKNTQERMELRKRSSHLPVSNEVFAGLKHTYELSGLKGYSGHFDEETLEAIRNHPDRLATFGHPARGLESAPRALARRPAPAAQSVAISRDIFDGPVPALNLALTVAQVDYIERDSEVRILGGDEPSVENNSPWGLARISHRDSLSFGTWNKYLYAADGGEGVDVYVIDTGTNVDHVDFEGRAKWGKTIPNGDADEDGNGHGTHCSGTVAGKKYGVAKKAHVYAVKVLRSNGSGTMSDVVKGVEFAAKSHSEAVSAAKNGKKKGFKGSTANMSLGGGKSTTLDMAVNAAVDAGLHFAVAAGNDNADSCNYSPAAAENAVTVGASTLLDERAYFSNYGKCNDIFAPGLNILSTWIGSNHATNTISGTSMASPHIAGLLAYMLSLQPAKDSAYAVADITPKKLKANLISIGTVGALSDVPSNTANVLAWNGGGSSNYTDIVEKGGYTVKKAAAKDEEESEFRITIPSLSELEDDFEKAKESAGRKAHHVGGKLQHLEAEIEDFIAEEMESMFEKVKERIASH